MRSLDTAYLPQFTNIVASHARRARNVNRTNLAGLQTISAVLADVNCGMVIVTVPKWNVKRLSILHIVMMRWPLPSASTAVPLVHACESLAYAHPPGLSVQRKTDACLRNRRPSPSFVRWCPVAGSYGDRRIQWRSGVGALATFGDKRRDSRALGRSRSFQCRWCEPVHRRIGRRHV